MMRVSIEVDALNPHGRDGVYVPLRDPLMAGATGVPRGAE